MGKLTHPSQGQELESAGRIPDQTENSISSKKCEKSVLCDGDIYYYYEISNVMFTFHFLAKYDVTDIELSHCKLYFHVFRGGK